MQLKVTDIKMVESYIETLKEHPKGKVRIYPLPKPFSYNGFHNAKTRLKKIGRVFEFENITNDGENFLRVKRTK